VVDHTTCSLRSCLGLEARVRHEVLVDGMEVGLGLVRHLLFSVDGGNHVGVLGSNVVEDHLFESANLSGEELVEVSVDTTEENADLLGSGHRDELVLLEELSKLFSSVELLLSSSIKIRTELSEGSDLSVLGKLELERTGDLLHGLDLGSRSDTGDGETDINSGSYTLEEELSLEEDLTVSNGDNVGGNVSGHITSLGLNDGEGSKRTGTKVLVHLGGTLEETRMEVENITRVSLTTRRSSEEEGHLSVGNSLLGQIVVDDKGVHAVVSEEFSESASGVGGDELEGSSIGGCGSNNNGVLEGVLLSEGLHNVGNGGSLLSNSNVDAVKLLVLVTGVEGSFLVKDGINGDSGLTGLSISNDKLTLSSTDGHEGIDTLKSGLHGLSDGFSGDNSGGLELDSLSLGGINGTESIDGNTEGIDDSTEESMADRDIDNGSGSLDDITFLDFSIVSEHDDTDVISLQVKSHTLNSGVELNHLSGLNLGETEDTGNTISNGDNSSEFLKVVDLVDSGNLGLQDGDGITNGRLDGVLLGSSSNS